MTPAPTQQQQALFARFEKLAARMDRLEKLASQSAAERAARLGAESATGSEKELEAANRRHRRELEDPTFAKSYFAAQRLTRIKVLRAGSLVPDRRNFCYRQGSA
jgi:hypothetical protein